MSPSEDPQQEPPSKSPEQNCSVWAAGGYTEEEGERAPDMSPTDGEDGALVEPPPCPMEEGE